MSSAVVLSSGGINSATVLEIALRARRPDPIHMLSFKYDAIHNDRECLASLDLYHYYLDRGENVTWNQIELPDLFKDNNPPFLNATMLSMATTYAVINNGSSVYTGMPIEDLFVSMSDVMYKGSDHKISLRLPLAEMTKADIIKRAHELEVPINLTWSCKQPTRHFPYDESKLTNSALLHCGECPTCKERIAGFQEVSVVDPVPYAIEIDWYPMYKSWPYIGEKQLRAK
jgi:7-cyano-7-deazaguanine synthase